MITKVQSWYKSPVYDINLDDNDVKQKQCHANTVFFVITDIKIKRLFIYFHLCNM